MKNVFQVTAILMLFVALLAFSGCEKDKNNKPSAETMLTGKNWKMTAWVSDPALDWFGAPVTNVYAQLPNCVKDDITIFQNNGVVKFDEGGEKCSENSPQTVTGSWTLNPAETIISITQNGETESWEILELTENTVKVETTVATSTVNYVFVITYKAL
jgi:hypothetical protein